MALQDSFYRVKIDNTYASGANATTVKTSIDNALVAAGRPERATILTTTNVTLMIVSLTEAEAVTLRDALKASWTAATRTFGKVSVTRTNDID